ncbi:hypothetical protein B9479_007187 [Cryptococcus floricola]|uniref:F-box domain-containing protein n=1 Tax=Cryptococcus floricola TaxID=2591691 RepID=A0A5D3ANH6_9TREE|nr:hypothetical protein B9479_007187 [Cryptococcus floricola]
MPSMSANAGFCGDTPYEDAPMVSSRLLNNRFRKTLGAIRPRSGTTTPITRPSTPESAPVFPQEILEQILADSSHDHDTLRALALTCKSLSPLALAPLWRQVSVGLESRSPMRTHYFGPTTREIISLGLLKPPTLSSFSAEVRSLTRIIDFYFRHFAWALALYRREHRFLELFTQVKVIRIHLDSLCGYISSGGAPFKYKNEDAAYENYVGRLPACEKAVFIGPCHMSYYERWYAHWKEHTEYASKAPKKLVLLLRANENPISFKFGSFPYSILSNANIPTSRLSDITIIFYQGPLRHKSLKSLTDDPWRKVREDLVDVLKMLRRKYPRTRVTLVNTGCFKLTWLGFDRGVKEGEVQERVKQGLKKVGVAKGVRLFGTFGGEVERKSREGEASSAPSSVASGSEGSVSDDGLPMKEQMNAGKETERLITLDEYLQTEDWEGEFDEEEVQPWLHR